MAGHRLNAYTFFASVLGLGFIPLAPGTLGTLLAGAVYILLPGPLLSGSGWFFYGIGLILLTAVAVFLSTKAEKKLGHDAPQIVIDEVCGYFLAVLLLPRTLMMAIYAFVLFRAFDIAKPYPVNSLQKLPKGWGVVADDLMAGLYANILLQIMIRIVPKFFGL
ncbi:MAG: phosphatidylglycerophosphatase A family protein [Candidatus Syntrophosphaera sp.]